jgi:hypothetical protein
MPIFIWSIFRHLDIRSHSSLRNEYLYHVSSAPPIFAYANVATSHAKRHLPRTAHLPSRCTPVGWRAVPGGAVSGAVSGGGNLFVPQRLINFYTNSLRRPTTPLRDRRTLQYASKSDRKVPQNPRFLTPFFLLRIAVAIHDNERPTTLQPAKNNLVPRCFVTKPTKTCPNQYNDPSMGYRTSQTKTSPERGGLQAGGKGFEPLLTDPESAVLPLDEPPIIERADFSIPPRIRQGRRSLPI